MTLLQALILGVVQGITEFLPVSSSGHLVIFPYMMGWDIPKDELFVFNVLIQMGTLVAVILFFWKDLVEIMRAWLRGVRNRAPFVEQKSMMGWYLIVATIPAGIAGLFLKDQIEAAFSSVSATATGLLITAGLLLLAEWPTKQANVKTNVDWLDAIVIGVYQALAIFPGVSRSGSTMTGGMLRYLTRQSAAKFSFLMSIPIMLAAGGLAIFDLLAIPDLANFLPNLIAGFVMATLVGYLAIVWLLRFLANHSLRYFAVYLIVLGVTLKSLPI